jgi:hypothetical protein
MSPHAEPPSVATPALSVIVVTRDRFESVRTFIEHLRRQTAVDRIELVLVGPSDDCWEGAEEHLADFRHCQRVTCERLETRGRGTACGVARATAPSSRSPKTTRTRSPSGRND